jgi:SAM-dependent methyltransferase
METHMDDRDRLKDQTIADFGDQWSKYTDNEGWYGSLGLFQDILSSLISVEALKNADVAEIGSGTGRIVQMLIEAGVRHVYAVEPSSGAFQSLERNVKAMEHSDRVTPIHATGDGWQVDRPLDYIFSVGVIHHIPDPAPVLKRAYQLLKPGGCFFMWVYGYEGNELYVRVFQAMRKITTRLPHVMLRMVVEAMYVSLVAYGLVARVVPLPLRSYIHTVWWPLNAKKRKLVIYDQLNPAYAKYYRKEEAIEVLRNAGFGDIKVHHRHGYSWSVLGRKQ